MTKNDQVKRGFSAMLSSIKEDSRKSEAQLNEEIEAQRRKIEEDFSRLENSVSPEQVTKLVFQLASEQGIDYLRLLQKKISLYPASALTLSAAAAVALVLDYRTQPKDSIPDDSGPEPLAQADSDQQSMKSVENNLKRYRYSLYGLAALAAGFIIGSAVSGSKVKKETTKNRQEPK